MAEDVIVSVKNADIFQGDSLILDDVNIEVKTGEFVYLIGKTGTGKSSFLKTLYADLELKEGDINVVGYEIKDIRRKEIPYLRRNLGVVFQDFKLLTDRNVNENMLFVLRATGWKDKGLCEDRIRDVLGKVGLEDKGDKMPFQLSGGEQQRVGIARALLNSPKLILADEPTGNLDPQTSEEIMNLLFNIKKELSTAIIMATHDYYVIEKFPSRMIKTEDGRMIDNASIELN